MDAVSVILPPLIGGLIGYFTNDLAIKMLFRPYEAKYLGKFRVPFTPGIVPKRLEQLAVLLGKEVEARFFNADDLEILFTSDGFSDVVAESITDMLYGDKMSLCWRLEELERDEELGADMENARKRLSLWIVSAAADMEIEPFIMAVAGIETEELYRSSARSALTQFAPAAAAAVKKYLRDNREAAAEKVGELLIDFADRPVCSIASEIMSDRAAAKGLFKYMYQKLMAKYVRPVVESIDVGGMITEKLRLMQPKDVEALILSVVNREFRYVVWLGGLLGAIIGTVNIFI